ncbi:MAG: glycosyltransferase family 2 protein [Candidatus Omnitrophica bacterium]|nr:glycosyltransferase family 2 protein [Candidatus Omnitrophota bacterium]
MTFSLVILSFNEIEALRVILPRIKKEWLDEIIFIDGASTDGSIEYAQSLGYQVTIQKGKGVMAGYKEGLAAVTSDVTILFTPDGNCLPEKIPQLIAKMKEGYDMVVCSRYKDGAKSEDDTLISGFGNWMFSALVRALFKAQCTDLLGIYRAFRKDIHSRLDIKIISRPVETRTYIRAITYGLKIAEIGGDEPARIGGKSCRSIIKNGFNELSIVIEEFFHLPSTFLDKILKF